ncbi:unnamed protein product, partial [Porites evermanni]
KRKKKWSFLGLGDCDTPVSGSTVYGFQTPKRRGALAQAASSAIHNKTPAHAATTSKRTKTPKTTNQKGKTAAGSSQDEHNVSGYSLRHRRKAVLLKGIQRESDSEDSDSERGEIDHTPASRYRLVCRICFNSFSGVPRNFSGTRGSYKCSLKQIGRAKLPFVIHDVNKLLLHLNQVSTSHPKERFDLYHKLQNLFDKWMFHLRNGFNILLYGLGSKRVLLDQFRSSKLSSYLQIVVNGYFPSLTIKSVLNLITEEVLMHNGSFKSVTDQCDYIKQSLSNNKNAEELFLVIHNIDGSMLRAKKTQTLLSLLAEVDNLHIIASVDHINAPLIWNHTQLGRFNWSWFDVTSFEPYKEETSYENSLLVQHTGALALSSLVHVFRSLTPNARGIFILIAGHQLEEKDNNSYIGMSFNSCYSKCREQFLVNSESTLKAQLIEFRDHKLITSKKGGDGVEYLYIPVDSATLKQFIEDQQNNNVG